MHTASLAVERLVVVQHCQQGGDLLRAEHHVILTVSKFSVHARACAESCRSVDGSHSTRAAGCPRPTLGFIRSVVEPDVHIIAMLAEANIRDFAELLDYAFVEEKADGEGFELGGRAHEGQPNLAVDRERDGCFDDDMGIDLLYFSVLKELILHRSAGVIHFIYH